MKKAMQINLIFLVLIVMALPNQIQANECDGILSVRDVDFSVRNLHDAELTNQKHCKADGTMRSSGGSLALSIPKIPLSLKLGGGSNKQKMEHFCKSYQNWRNKVEEDVSYKSSVSEKQWMAFDSCINLRSRGVNISPNIGRELITISLTRGTENFTFETLTASPSDAFDCRGKGNREIRKLFDTEMVSGESIAITCARKERKEDGHTFYQAGEIAITTNRGNLIIPVPLEEKYGVVYSSEIKKQLNAIKQRLDLASKRIDATDLACDVVSSQGQKSTWGATAEAKCPDGKILTGGGCRYNINKGHRSISQNQPRNNNAWSCYHEGTHSQTVAYAICCEVIN